MIGRDEEDDIYRKENDLGGRLTEEIKDEDSVSNFVNSLCSDIENFQVPSLFDKKLLVFTRSVVFFFFFLTLDPFLSGLSL